MLSRVAEELFPFFICRMRSARLQRKIFADDLVNSTSRYITWIGLSCETLDKLLEREQQRAKAIEDKTAKLTAIFAVALTIGTTFSATLAANFGGALKTWWGLALVLACLYIFLGGWISLDGMANRAIFGYGPDWELAVKKSKAPKALRVDALARWEVSNTRLALLNTAAIQCVRNGFLLFFIGTMLALSQPFIEGRQLEPIIKLTDQLRLIFITGQ